MDQTASFSNDEKTEDMVDIDSNGDAPESFLREGHLLKNRYEVLSVLGHGGFGLTYACRDVTLNLKVAVKEYYPDGFVTRDCKKSATVTYSTTPENMEFVEKGLHRFIDEARVLAKFSGDDGIVDVRDYFEENNTAYIVMEFLDGKDLRQLVKEQGVLSAEYILKLLLPVMEALDKVHRQGLIHRDISPDNIRMVGKKVKLLDFGAARDYSYDGTKTMTVLLKRGYAPIEQYGSVESQGPWTDVYALCATIYLCITGQKPPDALVRWENDPLKRPSQLGIEIRPEIENVIMKGLSVSAKDRYQSMYELIYDLNSALAAPQIPSSVPAPEKRKHKQGKPQKADRQIKEEKKEAVALAAKEKPGKEIKEKTDTVIPDVKDSGGNGSKKKGMIVAAVIAVLFIAAVVFGVFAWKNGWFSKATSDEIITTEKITSDTTEATSESTEALPERRVYGTISQSSNISVKVSGATIKIYQDDNLITTVTSDSSGGYVAHLEEGSYRAEITVAGYKDYEFEFEITADEDTSKDIYLETVPTGTVSGDIFKASDYKTSLSGVTITVYKGEESVLTAMSNSSGRYSLKLPKGDYLLKATKSGYVDFYAYVSVSVDETAYMSSFLMVDGSNGETGTAKGTIFNSYNGQGLPGVTLTVKKHWDNAKGSGSTVATTTTDDNGNYSLDLPLGNYTVIASKEGCDSEHFNIIVRKKVTEDQSIEMYQEPEAVNYTITLTWENDHDLDIYAYAPSSNYTNGDDYTIYYNREFVGKKDNDDTDGYGPETYTFRAVGNEPCYFYVYDCNENYSVKESNAKVTVSKDNSDVVLEYVVPAEGDGRYWDLFAIRSDQMVDKNKITDDTNFDYAG